MSLGIGKKALLEEYYYDEIGEIIAAWNALHRSQAGEETEMNTLAFLGEGGEWID